MNDPPFSKLFSIFNHSGAGIVFPHAPAPIKQVSCRPKQTPFRKFGRIGVAKIPTRASGVSITVPFGRSFTSWGRTFPLGDLVNSVAGSAGLFLGQQVFSFSLVHFLLLLFTHHSIPRCPKCLLRARTRNLWIKSPLLYPLS